MKTILEKDSEEIVSEVYFAQKNNPTKGDYCELVGLDTKHVNLEISESEIINLSRDKYKELVKGKVRAAALKQLTDIQKSHSKMASLKYTKLEAQKYMKSPLFDSDSTSLLLGLRTRTVPGIKNDFICLYSDVNCPLNCGDVDTLPKILTCKVLKDNMESTSVSNDTIVYEDIFSTDIVKQRQATELFSQLLQLREKIVNVLPVT